MVKLATPSLQIQVCPSSPHRGPGGVYSCTEIVASCRQGDSTNTFKGDPTYHKHILKETIQRQHTFGGLKKTKKGLHKHMTQLQKHKQKSSKIRFAGLKCLVCLVLRSLVQLEHLAVLIKTASEMHVALWIFSSTFIHFIHFYPFSSTFFHINLCSSILSMFIHIPHSSAFIHFHPLLSKFIHHHAVSPIFIHFIHINSHSSISSISTFTEGLKNVQGQGPAEKEQEGNSGHVCDANF